MSSFDKQENGILREDLLRLEEENERLKRRRCCVRPTDFCNDLIDQIWKLKAFLKTHRCAGCSSKSACDSTPLEKRKKLWKTGVTPCPVYLLLHNIEKEK